MFYAMPDIGNMKAMEMKAELESYGISTKSLFDKRDFERALVEARTDYEQTLQDVMGQQPPRGGPSMNSRYHYQQQQQHEQVHVNDGGGGGSDGGRYAGGSGSRSSSSSSNGRSTWSTGGDDTASSYANDYAANQAAGADSAGPSPFDNGPHHRRRGGRNGPQQSPSGKQTYYHNYKAGSMWDHVSPIEEDPLSAYDRQNFDFTEFGQHFQYHPNDPAARKQRQKRDEERARDWTYRGDYRRPPGHQYMDDPAREMKYQQALEEAKMMNVADLQEALNARGISTKFCFVLADFQHEYAVAVAENKHKRPDTSKDVDDEDYDPSYRDVVMERYDPARMA